MATKKSVKKADELPQEKVEQTKAPKKRWGLIIFLIAVVILLGFVLYNNRSYFVVATVDGQPIWKAELDRRMVSQIGQQTLDNLIMEQVIINEANKRGITVSDSELQNQVAEIQKTLPEGTTLEQAVSGQGMTMADFENRLRLQLLIEKMVPAQKEPTGTEIAEFLEANKDFMTATDEAGLTAEAKEALMSQNQNAAFQKTLEDLQSKAQVNKFL